MRASRSIVSILLAVCLIGVTVVPALAAETVKVQFQNKTGSEVRLSLSGPASYSLKLSTGKTNAEVVPGKYAYSYTACDGQAFKGTFNARKAGANLNLPKCKKESGGGGGEIKVTVNNGTGGSLTIYLSGPASYTFYFGTGKTKISIAPGKYTYTAYGCGGASITGTKNFKGGGNVWSFWCY